MVRTRAIPADFAETMKTMSGRVALKHFKVSPRVFQRWCQETGVVLAAPNKQRPIPEDFAENALLRNDVLVKMYRAADVTISRWRLEAGVKTSDLLALRARERHAANALPKAAKRFRAYNLKAAAPPQIDISTAGRAASFLKTRGWFVNDGKLWNRPGEWRVGTLGFMPVKDMIALAESKGFVARPMGMAA